MKVTLSAIIAAVACVVLLIPALGFALIPPGWDPMALAVSLFFGAVAVHWSGR